MSGLASRRTQITLIVAIAVLIAAIVVPIAVDDPYVQRIMAVAALESLLAVSLNLVLGYGGLISLAQVAFYGVGAYTAALLALRMHLPFLANLPVAMVLCGALAWAFARPLLRLRGHYFAIATFVFALLAQAIENNWESLTRGTNGLPGIPAASLVVWTAETNLDNYFLALGLLLVCVLAVARVVHSPFGRSLAAVRDDDRAAASVGIEVGRVRTIAFVLAAAIAGAGGALYAQYTTFVSAQPFGTDHMITILAAAAIGGLGTTMGPVAGATLLTVLPEVLRGFSNWRMVVFGALVIVVVLVRPDGLAGLARSLWAALPLPRRAGMDR